MKPSTHYGALRQVAADLWAGSLTALICYVEYMGLGLLLGNALKPGQPDGAALGTLLVMTGVVLCSVLALISHGASLAGPRSASLAVATTLLLLLLQFYPGSQSHKTALLGVMTMSASFTLLIGNRPWVQSRMTMAPRWLVQGFLFATALCIVAGSAAAGQLLSCVQVDGLAASLAYGLPVLVGASWGPMFEGWIHRAKKHPTAPKAVLTLLEFWKPLGLLVAAALSWAVYEQTRLAVPHGAYCGRFGTMDLDWTLLQDRFKAVTLHLPALSPAALVLAIVCGILTGLVLLLESLTSFSLNQHNALYRAAQPKMLAATAGAGVLTAMVGGVGASFSTARTTTLRSLRGTGRLAAPMHGVALLVVALLAVDWVAQVPKITAAVTLTMVGVQMVSKEMILLWKRAYHPRSPWHSQLPLVRFWLLLAISIAANNALVGFAVMVLLVAMAGLKKPRHSAPH